jgi:3-hydroxybutyryl-CoA dehydrogenase
MNVTVLGAGTMGHAIAQVAAMSGHDVVLNDVDADALARGIERIRGNIDTGVKKGKVVPKDGDAPLARIRGETDLATAVKDADLVIESVPERMDLKREIFARIGEMAPKGAVLATNTSSLSVTEIAGSARRPEKVVGMHFFNPPYALRLLEIIVADQTSKETLRFAQDVALQMGRKVITVKDVPGFATSRLGLALGLEAIRMLEQGVASAEDIDTAMVEGYRHPMGPLRLTDLVGLDVRLAIAEYLHEALGEEQFRPPDLLRRMVAEGKLGRKSGRGFHPYQDGS